MQIKKDEIIGYLELQIFNAEQEEMARQSEIGRLKKEAIEQTKKILSLESEQSLKKIADKLNVKQNYYLITKQIKSLEKEIEAFNELIKTSQTVMQALLSSDKVRGEIVGKRY